MSYNIFDRNNIYKFIIFKIDENLRFSGQVKRNFLLLYCYSFSVFFFLVLYL